MSMHDDRNRRKERLLDSDMTTVKFDRRSFIVKAIRVGAVVIGPALSVACGPTSDSFDRGSDGDVTTRGDTILRTATDTGYGDNLGAFADPRTIRNDSDVSRTADPPRTAD